MTHTLHRRGSEADLQEDFVMLIMPAKGFNLEGSEEKMQQIFEVLSHFEKDLTNFGNARVGNSHRTDMETLKKSNNRIAHAVFKDKETLKACLKELKEKDFGISIVISGLYDVTEKICEELGIGVPHTVEHSLETHGRTDKLPEQNTLEIVTMCGHAMVSPNLVTHLLGEIEAGKKTFEEAADILSERCDCGIFNPYRAAKILRKMASAG